MQNKMIKHGIAVIGIAILAFLSIASGATTPPSPPPVPKLVYTEVVYTEVPLSELKERIEQVNSPGQGFIVEAYFGRVPGQGTMDFYLYSYADANFYSNAFVITINTHESYEDRFIEQSEEYRSHAGSHNFERYDGDTYRRIDKNKLYKIYICVFYDEDRNYDGSIGRRFRVPLIDKIEGVEELATIEARERQAEEEANRYDPSKFTLVPSNFRPADYTARDLFNVVSLVEGTDLSSVIPNILLLDPFFVSDVVFVRQDGTDIWFRTDDNAITKNMKINSRSGLTAGQRVRLYYIVTKEQYRLPVWQVIAIERR